MGCDHVIFAATGSPNMLGQAQFVETFVFFAPGMKTDSKLPTAMTLRDVMLNRFKSKWCCLVSNPKLIGFFFYRFCKWNKLHWDRPCMKSGWLVQLVALNNILPTCPKSINLTHKRVYNVYIYIYHIHTCDAFSNRQTEQGGGTTNQWCAVFCSKTLRKPSSHENNKMQCQLDYVKRVTTMQMDCKWFNNKLQIVSFTFFYSWFSSWNLGVTLGFGTWSISTTIPFTFRILQ